MRAFFFVLLIVLCNYSCNEKRETTKTNSYNAGDSEVVKIDTLKTKYDNGKIYFTVPLIHDKMNGFGYYYFENGNTSAVYTYEDNFKKGYFKTYYDNGTIRSEGTLLNDSILNGQLNLYDINGKLFRTIFYENGKEILHQ